PPEEQGLGPREVRRARLLYSWTAAGLSVESIVELVDQGALSLMFLDAPVMATPERLDRSYQQLAADRGVTLALLRAFHQALGFAPPEAGDLAGEDDVTMLDVTDLFHGAGVGDDAILRLLAVYADSLRRIAKAEAEFYEANIERRLRAGGLGEPQLIEFGTRFGDRVIGLLEEVLVTVYRRHREHIWTEHAINHVEEALEGSGLEERVPRPPAICFVDLTGYTQLTEEHGDEVAAHVAGRLAALVNDISRSRAGRPGRWLGDGGMFHFPGAPDGPARRTGHGPARPGRRPATRPRGHPHRPGGLPGRGRLREDREPGGQDRRLRPGRAGGGERGHGPAVRRRRAAAGAARAGRAEGRGQAPAPVPGAANALAGSVSR
ncbi:MAG TPA: hypothetical protein VJ140_11400, partial [Actinomycetota bacterium]|nr:hypothetical protein [Actinomycetota bacterium]